MLLYCLASWLSLYLGPCATRLVTQFRFTTALGLRHWNSLTSETAFNAAASNKSYSEHLHRPYTLGVCTAQRCEAPSILSDTFIGQAIACYDLSIGFLSESPEVSTTTLVAAANLDVDLLQFPHAKCASLQRTSSASLPGSSEPSNNRTWSPDYESPSKMPTGAEPSTKRRRKTQGRPRLNPIATYVPGASNASQRTTRVSHTAVERKYREGLTAELERLRRAVLTLVQSHEGSSIGQPKPSKSMVIAATINHIQVIGKERNALQKETMRSESLSRATGAVMFADL
jgi:hypothetical protein